jgi:hypothetical protein
MRERPILDVQIGITVCEYPPMGYQATRSKSAGTLKTDIPVGTAACYRFFFSDMHLQCLLLYNCLSLLKYYKYATYVKK